MTHGHAASPRDENLLIGLLRFVRNNPNQMPGELGNKFGFRNYETALSHGYIESAFSAHGKYNDLIALTPAGERRLIAAAE